MKVEDVLKRTNELYAVSKGATPYTAPELRAEIRSEQVKCAVRALCELLEEEKNHE